MEENYSETVAIDISTPLKVRSEDIEKYLTVELGQKIEEDSILARKKSFLGVEKTEIRSPVFGILDSVDKDRGVLIVRLGEEKEDSRNEKEVEENDFSDKEKNNKIKQEKIQISNSVKITALDGFGDGEGYGYYCSKDLSIEEIDAKMKGRIILIENLPEIKILYKASAIGAEGIVSQGADKRKIKRIKHELENKTHLGFLVVSETVDLSSLENRYLSIKDNNLMVN